MDRVLLSATSLIQRNIDLSAALAEVSCGQSGVDFLRVTFEDVVHLLKGEEEEEGRGGCLLQQQQPGVLAPQLLWEAVRGVLLQRTQHSEHVLQPAAREDVTALVSLGKQLQGALLFDHEVFARAVLKDIQVVPLEVLWILLSSGVLHLRQFMSGGEFDDRFVHLMTSIPRCCDGDEHTLRMLRGLSTSLVGLGFPEQSSGVHHLQSARELLYRILTESYSLDGYKPGCSTVLDGVAGNPCISQSAVQQALASFLRLCFHSKPLSAIPTAVADQDKWKLSSLAKHSAAMFTKLSECVADPLAVVEHCMLREELNWSAVLSFVSCFLHACDSGVRRVSDLIAAFIDRAVAEGDCHLLHCSLLLARQAALEGAHIFPPYRQWFKQTFGNSPSTVVASKKALHLLVRSLTQLVPYEPPDCLRVHVSCPPRGLASCKDLIADYVALAKTRLKDLKEPISEQSTSAGGKEGHTEEVLAMGEARKAVEHFAKNHAIPVKVLETSMLQKPYFIGRFLPALLSPSLEVDSKAREGLIEKLCSKIPARLLEGYKAAVERGGANTGPPPPLPLPPPHSQSAELARVSSLLARLKDTVSSDEGSSKLTKLLSKLSDAIGSVILSHTSGSCSTGEVDLRRPGLLPWEVQLVDCIISTICETVVLVYSCEGTRRKWLGLLIAMLSNHHPIHCALLVRLWELLHSQGEVLSPSHQLGLAVCCAELWQSEHSFRPLVLAGSDVKELQSCSSYAVCLVSGLQVNSAAAMTSTASFCCHFVQYVLTGDTNQFGIGPSILLHKMHYLYSRYGFLEVPAKGTVLLRSTVNSLMQLEAFTSSWNTQQVSFACWLQWELAVEPSKDFLTPHRRLASYLRSTIFDHFLSTPVGQGGIADTAVAFTQLFSALVREEQCESFAEGVRQLQEPCNVLPTLTGCSKPCLLQVLGALSEEESAGSGEVMQRCIGVVCSIPTFLFFCNSLGGAISQEHVQHVATCLNTSLVPHIGCHFILPSTLTMHLFQGAWSLDKATPSRSLLEQLISASPIFQASLICHWSQIKRVATSLTPQLLLLEQTNAWLITPSTAPPVPSVGRSVMGVCVFWKQLEEESSMLPDVVDKSHLAYTTTEVLVVVFDCCVRELLTVSGFTLEACSHSREEDRLLTLASECLSHCPAAIGACSGELDHCGVLKGLIEDTRSGFRSKGELRCLCLVLFQVLHHLGGGTLVGGVFQRVLQEPAFPALCVTAHAACMKLNSCESDTAFTQYEPISIGFISWCTDVSRKVVNSTPIQLRKEIESSFHYSLKTCL